MDDPVNLSFVKFVHQVKAPEAKGTSGYVLEYFTHDRNTHKRIRDITKVGDSVIIRDLATGNVTRAPWAIVQSSTEERPAPSATAGNAAPGMGLTGVQGGKAAKS